MIHSGHMFLTVNVILLDIGNAFQIWSTLAGYERLDGGFEQIRNGEFLVLRKMWSIIMKFQGSWMHSLIFIA